MPSKQPEDRLDKALDHLYDVLAKEPTGTSAEIRRKRTMRKIDPSTPARPACEKCGATTSEEAAVMCKPYSPVPGGGEDCPMDTRKFADEAAPAREAGQLYPNNYPTGYDDVEYDKAMKEKHLHSGLDDGPPNSICLCGRGLKCPIHSKECTNCTTAESRLSTVVDALRNMTDCPSAPTFCNCPAHEKWKAILRDFPQESKP